MRHMKKGNALNRSQSHRRWMLSNMVTSLFQHERIETTVAKAKEARPLAEKLITFAKRGDLHARRLVLRIVRDKAVVEKLFSTLGERYRNRPGGYTRILRLRNRLGDNATMVIFELVKEESRKGGSGRRRRGRKKKETPAAAEQKAAEAVSAQTAAEVAQAAPETAAEPKAEEKPAE
ncbi:50S ribosomal protein L17 [bacterium]|nr:50S ribosomal protein L17 [bacterium]